MAKRKCQQEVVGCKMLTKWVVFIFTAVHSVHVSESAPVDEPPILIITSFDALGYKFINESWTPNLMHLRHRGTFTKYMRNVFPTKTFTNHFSIATGLYSEYHGVIGNSYYDSKYNKTMGYGPELFAYSKETVPIWTLNELAGPDRHSASFMWPGANYPYQGITPTFMQPYVKGMDSKKGVDLALSWLTHKKTPANLLMLYFDDPDHHGHAYGTHSPEFKEQVSRVDKIADYLDERLKQLGLTDRAHVIHLSDHGMLDVPVSSVINITKYLTPGTYNFGDSSPTLHVSPEPGYETAVYNQLLKAQSIEKHFKVFKKSELPDRWQLSNCTRTPPIFVLCDAPYLLDDFPFSWYNKDFNKTDRPTDFHGIHGFDNNIDDMYGFFMARGPKIKVNYELEPFDNVDLYSLFSNILKLKPNHKTNSTFAHVGPMLKLEYAIDLNQNLNSLTKAVANRTDSGSVITFVLVIAACLVTLFSVGFMVVWMMQRKQTAENVPQAMRRHINEVGDEPDVPFNSSTEIQGLLFNASSEDEL